MKIDESLAIYLHIPFCTTKCTYCAFNTYTNLQQLIPQFVESLIKEIVIVGASNPYRDVSSIYFGGGTPSLLSPLELDSILDALYMNFPIKKSCEISFEANPNDLNLGYLRQLRAFGINRLSIGMQSANPHELKLFDRRHDVSEVEGAFDCARQAGFENVNLDLIYGLPAQKVDDWRHSLEYALLLKPEHISLYALGLEDGTPLKNWVENGALASPDDDLAADMYDLATTQMAERGYTQYEISNWSKPGYACQHNMQYWRNLPYIGLGPGAHGFAGQKRYSTILSPQRYIKRLHDNSETFEFPENPVIANLVLIDREAEIAETVITGLRLLDEGIIRKTFFNRFGVDMADYYGDRLTKFVEHKLMTIDSESIKITPQGRLLSNLIFRELV
ncbi:MAG: radical SAM family heme chaperone HemW [Aggregatilineales bacterium]